MKIKQLYTQLTEEQKNILTIALSSNRLCIDSRKLQKGDIFCAYPGVSMDGRNFIDHAINSGTSLVLYEAGYLSHISVPSIPIKNLAQFIGVMASEQLDSPSNKVYVIGVTGTNGKTSICHWLNQAYSLLSNKVAIIGTTGCGVYPQLNDYASTTPAPILLQYLFSEFVKNDVGIVAMEVSSHALVQGRVNGTKFKQAIFTNLTQDHLDYHNTMEDYYQAKKQLFVWDGLESIIINTDDDYGLRLYGEISNKSLICSYGINKNADVRAKNITTDLSGVHFDLMYKNKLSHIKTNIIGEFNVSNMLAVVASLVMRNIAFENVVQILNQLNSVTGRMEAIKLNNCPLVIVDFAHTPDALFKALQTLKNIRSCGELYCIFGCGGNRDKTKRPLMGKIASELADKVIVTSDNPRNEDPSDITDDILAGILLRKNVTVIIDRKTAILQSIKNAKCNDIILIAGKGHENYQEIGDVKHHFSDQEIVLLNK